MRRDLRNLQTKLDSVVKLLSGRELGKLACFRLRGPTRRLVYLHVPTRALRQTHRRRGAGELAVSPRPAALAEAGSARSQ
jgi:hypothetical protein